METIATNKGNRSEFKKNEKKLPITLTRTITITTKDPSRIKFKNQSDHKMSKCNINNLPFLLQI